MRVQFMAVMIAACLSLRELRSLSLISCASVSQCYSLSVMPGSSAAGSKAAPKNKAKAPAPAPGPGAKRKSNGGEERPAAKKMHMDSKAATRLCSFCNRSSEDLDAT